MLPENGCPVLVTSHAGDLNQVCLWCYPVVGNVATHSVSCLNAIKNVLQHRYAPFQFRAYRRCADVQIQIGVAWHQSHLELIKVVFLASDFVLYRFPLQNDQENVHLYHVIRNSGYESCTCGTWTTRAIAISIITFWIPWLGTCLLKILLIYNLRL